MRRSFENHFEQTGPAVKPIDLRGILHYIPRFRDKIFVLAVDGAAVAHENFTNVLLDIAVLRSLNIQIVLVHGVSAQIETVARERGVTPSNLDGGGVTDAATLEIAIAASNRLTHKILEGLSINDLRGAATNGIIAHPKGILRGVDQGWTGKVERIDTELFRTLLERGIVPVVPPLGLDGEGQTYRVNSDHVAVELATHLNAIKLLFLTSRDGLIRNGELVRQLQVQKLDQALARATNEFSPESLSKAEHAAIACRSGVPRVHVINGLLDKVLLIEVFSNEGIGTLVYANEYQEIRPALKKDVRRILALTEESVAKDELIKRTRSDIEKNLKDYYILELDKNPIACVALHCYPDRKQGELAYLCVSPSHENQGVGRKLVRFAEEKARELGLEDLIVLSTQAYSFFQKKAGFIEGAVEDLPPSRRDQYHQNARQSRILKKSLGS